MEQMQTEKVHDSKKNYAVYAATVLFGIIFLAVAALSDWDSTNSYTMYNSSAKSYIRGRVESVESERLETDENDHTRYLGDQKITVKLLEGKHKGQTVTIDNYLSQTHNIYVRENQKIIVCADEPDGVMPYYTVYNYDRRFPIVILIAVFVLVMVWIGRGKGIRALLGIVFTLAAVMLFMAQAIYHGFSPVAVTILTLLLATAVSLILLNGISRRTLIAALATVLGLTVTGLIFRAASGMLHLSGFNMDQAEELLIVSSSTGLSVKNLLLAGLLISALGAVMDVAVSLTASLQELIEVKPALTKREMVQSGLNIGKDMIGTMSNTLILAFAGTSLNTILSLTAYGTQKLQLMCSDFLAIELSQGICATIGVILTVPITTWISAALSIKNK